MINGVGGSLAWLSTSRLLARNKPLIARDSGGIVYQVHGNDVDEVLRGLWPDGRRLGS